MGTRRGFIGFTGAVATVACMAAGMAQDGQPNTPAADTVRAADDRQAPAGRKYLLEQVDDAAVAQLYADGFESLPLDQKLLIWHLYEAALAGRDIYYDQRYAHNLEMRDVLEEILTHPSGVEPGTLGEIQRYTEALLAQHRPLQQPHRPEVRPESRPGRICRGRPRGPEGWRAIPGEARRNAGRHARADAAVVLRPGRRSDRHEQDAGAREGHPRVERQQPLRRRHDEGSRGLPRAVPPELEGREAERQACRGGLPDRWTLRRADPADRRPSGGGDSVRVARHGARR